MLAERQTDRQTDTAAATLLTDSAEKLRRRDTLTPLDARNSLLLDRSKTAYSDAPPALPSFSNTGYPADTKMPYTAPSEKYTDAVSDPVPAHARAPSDGSFRSNTSRENLVLGAAPLGGSDGRQPSVPSVDGGGYSEYGVAGQHGYVDQGQGAAPGGYDYRNPYGGF